MAQQTLGNYKFDYLQDINGPITTDQIIQPTTYNAQQSWANQMSYANSDQGAITLDHVLQQNPQILNGTTTGTTLGTTPGLVDQDYVNAKTNYYKAVTNHLNNQDGFWHTAGRTTLGVIQGVSSLGNLYLGFQNLGLAKKQEKRAEEQWNQTKNELARIKSVRKNLTKSYMGD